MYVDNVFTGQWQQNVDSVIGVGFCTKSCQRTEIVSGTLIDIQVQIILAVRVLVEESDTQE